MNFQQRLWEKMRSSFNSSLMQELSKTSSNRIVCLFTSLALSQHSSLFPTRYNDSWCRVSVSLADGFTCSRPFVGEMMFSLVRRIISGVFVYVYRYLIGEEGYCLTSLQSALTYVESLVLGGASPPAAKPTWCRWACDIIINLSRVLQSKTLKKQT